MPLTLTRLDPAGEDRAGLTAFLTENVFPFHVQTRPTPVQVRRAIDDGRWGDSHTESFWIDDEAHGRVGVLRLDDLADPTAMVDLRLAERWRGHGLGAAALERAATHVFRTRPEVLRLEGQTRADHRAMRRTFERCGWLHEATYRDGWLVAGKEPLTSVAYSLLRRDHASGTTTPLDARDAAAPGTQDRVDGVASAWTAEERLLEPAVRRDPDQVGRLLHEDFVEIGQSGRRWTRAAIIDALVAERGDDPAPVLTERASRFLAPDTVLLEYRLGIGDRVSRRSSIWRLGSEPQCLFHQGTPSV